MIQQATDAGKTGYTRKLLGDPVLLASKLREETEEVIDAGDGFAIVGTEEVIAADATADPGQPIWDRFTLARSGLRAPAQGPCGGSPAVALRQAGRRRADL